MLTVRRARLCQHIHTQKRLSLLSFPPAILPLIPYSDTPPRSCTRQTNRPCPLHAKGLLLRIAGMMIGHNAVSFVLGPHAPFHQPRLEVHDVPSLLAHDGLCANFCVFIPISLHNLSRLTPFHQLRRRLE
ncbi:hypothetical protein BU24DRAFT_106756 [Aaosphaeria arxii CBS 175.79]|uniref:Uncharacterized protein n=1 Tax=Aaosphaeria arxii CBS 175.79 TaxID=1450172 RepID=A0A6A5Y012_9PLEO|nr:uncharacterized protein BU24DRAFT_106756 [Aaosphaeria arxii CBS 175.79]KAF2018865.1 hypothetical protein BU24DRAFT_106756 [Aaosphaeria arxii CBS 175.79]